jgi:hypothetical protein
MEDCGRLYSSFFEETEEILILSLVNVAEYYKYI